MKKFLERLLTDAISTLLRDLWHRKKSQRDPRDDTVEAVTGVCYRVIDGDSLYINGLSAQIRLWGVDAPEVDEQGYETAMKTLKRLAHRQKVRVEQVTIDKYGRIIGRVYLEDGREINRLMIESGTTDEYCRFTRGYYGHCN